MDWDSDGCVRGMWLFSHEWCHLLTGFDVARFYLFCCRHRCLPCHSSWPQQVLLTWWLTLQLALLDPKGLHPPMWTGCPHATTFMSLPLSRLLCNNALTSRSHFGGSASARSLICSSVSGINKDLNIYLTYFILYDLMLTLFTYISRSMKKKRQQGRLK